MPRDQRTPPQTPTLGYDDRYGISPTNTSIPLQHGSPSISKRRKASTPEGLSLVESSSSRVLQELLWDSHSSVYSTYPLNGPLGSNDPHSWIPPLRKAPSAVSTSYQPRTIVPFVREPSASFQTSGPNGFGLRESLAAQDGLHIHSPFRTLRLHHNLSSQRDGTMWPGRVSRLKYGRGVPFDPRGEERCEVRQKPRYDGPSQVPALSRAHSKASSLLVYAGNGSGGQYQRKRRGNLPKSAINQLKAWFEGHRGSPYPTEGQKQALCKSTELSINQVRNSRFAPMQCVR